MMFTINYVVKIILFVVLYCTVNNTTAQDSNDLNSDELFEKGLELRFQKPDQSIELLEKAHENYLIEGDTLSAIKTLLEMPYQYGQKVDYAKTYDGLWHALFLADDLDNQAIKASIYTRLGRLYSFYKKEENALEYLNNALKINKELVANNEVDVAVLVQNYYLFCATFRELDKPKLAKKYLDSCFLNYNDSNKLIYKSYLKFEKSFVLTKEEKYQEALEIMNEIEPWFLENRPSYLVLVYTYWGDIYRNQNNLNQSEIYYQKAIEISSRYNSHLDFSILVHERLANLYITKGNYEKAYASQSKAKALDAQFFDSRSPLNRPLLEIKDEFRLEKERQEKLIQQQRLEQLEQEDKISFLQQIILLGALVFTLILAFVYISQIRAKHKVEKALIRRNKELEIQKSKELLELKNKELATSALQLVEKDEFLKDIKSKLKGENGNIQTAEINRVLKSISHSNQNNWDEFKLRFTQVNEDFYKQVTTRYPKLSQADQKICALIKLNFSSKEMARLLGISVESVHTTRYRLRKKMGLDRSVNLEDFIANI
ncbi:hypothetical protein [Aurantibacter sp.]|uniref:tetratricopeptide repeat protein n=1 Tax=Aurantibacter sp. TaxID=2807103 RepID=UPI0032672DF0